MCICLRRRLHLMFSIKQPKQFKYLGIVLTEEGKCETEIRCRIGIVTDVFQNLSRVLRNRQITLKTKST